jgi:hypothetical protein
MKVVTGILVLLALAGCASTWVDPKLNVKDNRILVECVNDPLGLGPVIQNSLAKLGVETKPSDALKGGDLVLKVTYQSSRTDNGLTSIQAVKSELVDQRYHTVVGHYEWNGKGDSPAEASQKLIDALVNR